MCKSVCDANYCLALLTILSCYSSSRLPITHLSYIVCKIVSILTREDPAPLRSRAIRRLVFLWYGRSRSKARSLHEKKLLLRKLLHGHRWSHAAWQIIKTKTQTTKNTRQDADPPARFASHHQKDSKENSERGKSPTETTTKDLPRQIGKNPLCRNRLKNLQQTN